MSAALLIEAPPFLVGESFLLRPFLLVGEVLVGDFMADDVDASPGEDTQFDPLVTPADSNLADKVFIKFKGGSESLPDFLVDFAFFPLLGVTLVIV